MGLRPGVTGDYFQFKPGYFYWTQDRYFFPATVLLFLSLGILWSGLRGRFALPAGIAAACWCLAMYFWGYAFHPWTGLAPKFANYGLLIKSTERQAVADGKIHKLYIPIAPHLWFAVLEIGKRKTSDGVRQEVVPFSQRLTDFFDLEGPSADRPGLRRSRWFGVFDDSQFPQVDHKVYGRMTLVEASTGGFWFWSQQEGPFWTSDWFFPRVFSAREANWIQLTPQATR